MSHAPGRRGLLSGCGRATRSWAAGEGSGAPADCGSAACGSGRAGSRCLSPPPARRPAATRPRRLRLRVPARSAPRAAGWVTHAEPRAGSSRKPSPRARRDAARSEREGWREGGMEGWRASAAPQPPDGRLLRRGQPGCGRLPPAPVAGPAGDTLRGGVPGPRGGVPAQCDTRGEVFSGETNEVSRSPKGKMPLSTPELLGEGTRPQPGLREIAPAKHPLPWELGEFHQEGCAIETSQPESGFYQSVG